MTMIRLKVVSTMIGLLISFHAIAAESTTCQQDILGLRSKGKLKAAASLASSCCEDKNDGFACNQLGFLIEMGSYKSTAKPESLYLKSCEAGYVGGCKNAATLYKGRGEREHARAFYHKACELKDGDACAEEILMDY